MLDPAMMDPAVVSFFKQAGEAFRQTVAAESEGRMDKALERYCGPNVPQEPSDEGFDMRSRLYAAKAYAMAHIDGATTWGEIGRILDASSVWPAPSDLNAQGTLFHAFLIGFLIGSDLPKKRQDTIETLIPITSRVTSSPDSFADKMGMTPEAMQQMANNPNLEEMAARFSGAGGFNPEQLQGMLSNPMIQQMMARFMGNMSPDQLQKMASDPRVMDMLSKFMGKNS